MTNDVLDIVKRIRALRAKHGAKTSIGHLYGNLSQQLLNFSVDEQNLNLQRAIAATVYKLEQRRLTRRTERGQDDQHQGRRHGETH
jgi:hypothetical protein